MSKKKPDRWAEAADGYEKLIAEGKIKWKPLVEAELPVVTRHYYRMFIKDAKLKKIEVAEQRLGGTVLLKLNDPEVPYFHHDPRDGAHQWGDEGFHNAIDNNTAIIRLARLANPRIDDKMSKNLKGFFDQVDSAVKN